MSRRTSSPPGYGSDESDTLLGSDLPGYGATDPSDAAAKVEPTPLPMGQILLLSLTRVSEPLTFCVLFPFVNQMVLDTGQVSVEDVGYAVGLVETSFSFTQVLFLIYWSRAADSWGRKPVLLFSLLGAFVSSILFGFSTRMWQMYAARCLAGIFGGNAVVIRTLFAENCDKSNQARAFSFFAFAANIGSLVGPTMGGFLASPATEFPSVFGHIQLFIDYPYALPCLAAGGYVFVTMVLCFFYLKEPPRAKVDKPLTVREALQAPTPRMLAIYGVTVGTSFCVSALLPLHLFTPIELGGQNQSPSEIARVMAASGLSQSLWLLIVMPKLDVWLGTKKLFILTAATYPFVMVIPVLASVAARGGSMGTSYALLGLYVTLGSEVNMTFTSVQLLLNSTTRPAALSIVNGVAQMIAASVKSVFPAAINALYALGVSHQILAGYLAWFAMALIGFIVFVCALYSPVDIDDMNEDEQTKVTRVLRSEAETVGE